MAGIYIHYPFCKKACNYCNFHFSTGVHHQNDFLDALLKEISLQKSYLESVGIETIYFGGGTPSLAPVKHIEAILNAIGNHFKLKGSPEVTLEANPDDITQTKVTDWAAAGINRLSIGIQSFHEEDLRWMNRAHNAAQALECLNIAKRQFKEITIDLIFGTPLLTDEKWHYNVETATRLGIPHLSCYALTSEEGTLLHHQIKKGLLPEPLQEDQARQFEWLVQSLEVKGYEHYEISNFALPGHRSRHNSSYWKGTPYLGLGPSAHSFNGTSRQWNVANNAIYIRSLQQDNIPFEQETLTTVQSLNEYIMISLRTAEGLVNDKLRAHMDEHAYALFTEKIHNYISRGLLEPTDTGIRLTSKGKLFADGIAADLFI